jgi:hypothetical protein
MTKFREDTGPVAVARYVDDHHRQFLARLVNYLLCCVRRWTNVGNTHSIRQLVICLRSGLAWDLGSREAVPLRNVACARTGYVRARVYLRLRHSALAPPPHLPNQLRPSLRRSIAPLLPTPILRQGRPSPPFTPPLHRSHALQSPRTSIMRSTRRRFDIACGSRTMEPITADGRCVHLCSTTQ